MLLLGFGAIVLLLCLGYDVALSRHEVFVAQAAREMLTGSPWVVQSFGGDFRLQKPPGASWIVAITTSLFHSRDEWFVRLPFALCGIATAWMMAVVSGRLLGSRVGLLTGLLMLCTFWMQKQARLAEADIVLTCCVTGAMCLFAIDVLDDASRAWRRWAFFALLTASVLVKGVGPIIVLPAVALYWYRTRNPRVKAFLTDWVGWLILIVPIAFWAYWALKTAPEISLAWKHETLDRATGDHDRPITALRYLQELFYFALWIPVLMLPTTPAAIIGLIKGLNIQSPDRRRQVGEWLLCWSLPWLVLMTLSAWKHFHYIMPILPALGVYAGVGMDHWMRTRRSPRRALVLASLLFIGTAVAMVAIQKTLMPAVDGYKFGRNFAAQVNRVVPVDQEVYFVGIGQASIAYYIDRPIRRVDHPTEFSAKIPKSDSYALTEPDFMPDLNKSFHVEVLSQLHETATRHLPADLEELTLVRLKARD